MARDKEKPHKIISQTLIFCAFLFFFIKALIFGVKKNMEG